MADPFARATASVFARLGVSALYTPAAGGAALTIQVIPSPGLALVGDGYQQVSEERMSIAIQVTDVARAQRHDTIAVQEGPFAGNTYTVHSRVSQDGYSATYLMVEAP